MTPVTNEGLDEPMPYGEVSPITWNLDPYMQNIWI